MTYLAPYLAGISGAEKSEVTTAMRALWAGQCVSVCQAPYNADPTGGTDSTAAIQAAIDSGARAVHIPAGTYQITSLTMPLGNYNFVLFGDGSASALKQMPAGGEAGIKFDINDIHYDEQTIRNIGFLGVDGDGHCIDTRGGGGCTIRDIFITHIPAGKSGIYSSGVNGVYNHDVRIDNIQIYSTSPGHSGVRFGPFSSDCMLSNLIMHGNFVVDYCIYADPGALSQQVYDCHPYAAAKNIVHLAGSNTNWRFTNCALDYSTEDLVVINNTERVQFTACWFQACQAGYSNVVINGPSQTISFMQCLWDAAFGAVSCIKADANSNYIFAFGGCLTPLASWTKTFDFPGVGCTARGIGGQAPLGLLYNNSGASPAAQPQNSTRYLGVGAAATEQNAEYVVPHDSLLTKIYVSSEVTPAVGQTFTFRARHNGVDIGTPLVVSNGQFGGTITLDRAVPQYDRITISSVFSATSGAASPRWSMEFTA